MSCISNQQAYEEMCEKAKKYNKLIEVLQEIRQEIEKPLRQEQFYDTSDAKAQAIALNWCLELIDKHIKQIEGEDIGDYPDTIPNQFDNLTGSMNL